MALKRKYRLSNSDLFQRVRQEGEAWSNRLAVLCARSNDIEHNRYGFAVSRHIGKAVVRNRVKRLLREAIRLRHAEIDSGWDLVFIARHPIREATYQEVDEAVTQLLQQASLLSEWRNENIPTDID